MSDGLWVPEGLDKATFSQVEDAMAFLGYESGEEIGFKWTEWNERVGPPLAQDLVIVAARPGNGKTTWAMNHLEHLVDHGARVLYVGMEMTADLLRLQYASWASHLPWEDVAFRRWERLPPDARARLGGHLEFQRDALRGLLFFAPDERLTVDALRGHIEWIEKKHGPVHTVVVDHLHRMSFGLKGENLTEVMGEAVVQLKTLAKKHNTRMIVAAQLKRGMSADVTNDYKPQSAEAIKQTGNAEQEANLVITLNRAMAPGVNQAMITAVQRGLRPVADIALNGVMNARVAKHRLIGEMKDVDLKLHLHRGRLYPSEAEKAEAMKEDFLG